MVNNVPIQPLAHPVLAEVVEKSSPPRAGTPNNSNQQHTKTPSGGSVRSILKDKGVPASGQSVRWTNNSTHFISPNVSNDTGASSETSVQTSLLSRFENAEEDEDEARTVASPSSSPTPRQPAEKRSATFPPLYDPDPFAATPVARSSSRGSHYRTESIASAASIAHSTLELAEPPSANSNLLDMSTELPSISLSESINDAVSGLFDQIAAPLNEDESFDHGVKTPRQSMFQPGSASVSRTVRGSLTSTPSPSKVTQLGITTTPPHHPRPVSEAPTIRANQSPIRVAPLSPPDHRESSPLASTPDTSIYQTPRTEFSKGGFTPSPLSPLPTLTSANPAKPGWNPFADLDNSGYIPDFLKPETRTPDRDFKRDSYSPGKEILNPAFSVPNNSIVSFPNSSSSSYESSLPMTPTSPTLATGVQTQALVAESALVAELKQRLELYESMSDHYEADLSARDELVEELSMRVSKADEEVTAWRNEAERTTRRFEKMRSKVTNLAAQCEELTTERRRANMFDQASSAALKQMHERMGSLQVSRESLEEKVRKLVKQRDDERARNQQLKAEREHLERSKEEAELEAIRWKERSREWERESELMADQLNSFVGGGDISSISLGSSYMRPASVHVLALEDIVDASLDADGAGAEGGDSRTPTSMLMPSASPGRTSLAPPSDLDALQQASSGSDGVYVSRNDIISRERTHRSLVSSLQSTIEKLTTERDALLSQLSSLPSSSQIEKLQNDFTIQREELESQWSYHEAASEEITTLQEEKKDLLQRIKRSEEGRRMTEQQLTSEKGTLSSELQSALERVGELEGVHQEVRTLVCFIGFQVFVSNDSHAYHF